MLNVIIGLLLIFLLYSLFATTILELLAAFLSFRGRNLEKAILNMLDPDNPDLFREFKENPVYKQLAGQFIGKTSPPSYLSSEKFRSILFQVLGRNQESDKVEEWIGKLPEGPLKSTLGQLLQDARQDKEEFKQKVEMWFNDVMDRASGWYKRNMQRILIMIGMGIAISFNVDSLQVYGQLSRDPDAANKMAMEAAKVVSTAEPGQEQPAELKKEVYSLLAENLEVLKSPLGIGWEKVDLNALSLVDWMAKLFGWIVTAFAISLGAPFWFDLLKKLVNIRSSGSKPA